MSSVPRPGLKLNLFGRLLLDLNLLMPLIPLGCATRFRR